MEPGLDDIIESQFH